VLTVLKRGVCACSPLAALLVSTDVPPSRFSQRKVFLPHEPRDQKKTRYGAHTGSGIERRSIRALLCKKPGDIQGKSTKLAIQRGPLQSVPLGMRACQGGKGWKNTKP